MTYDEAKHLLLLHGPGTESAQGEPLIAEQGFLHSLRPYEGNLVEKNFHLVMEALFTVGDVVHRSRMVDRDLVHALWTMCSTARGWGLHPEGMLQRNKLISRDDTGRLERWVDTIESTAFGSLGGRPPHYSIFRYAEYVTEAGWWDNIDFFIPLLERAISDTDLSEPSIAAEALGKIGGKARPALPTLYQALARQYVYYTPEDRCTEEVRGVIQHAIDQIEAAQNGE